MPYDFKKEFKALYQPKSVPEVVTVPTMTYAAVRGGGDPNEEGGAYKRAVSVLYGILYTIKMSKRGERPVEGYFDFVVPPLEGFWENDPRGGKERFRWISVLRLPDFVTAEVFDWAKAEAARKKKTDCSAAEMLTVDEGLCVQCMHIGGYDDEPRTAAEMDRFLAENGYVNDFSGGRLHHEIYLSDPNKCAAEKLKTVIRHPICGKTDDGRRGG
ncbi:MAG: GyrI-like domain-containing protein [Lachnospiraceae bacterium]|nr:GyrI-like domain-containing protein [Ruminococcus sp.]MCM1274703.1 GyrI-like domain-containing protein [Lachnospiraceae bacterium]